MKSRPYGQLPNGAAVELYTLTNAAGASLDVITYGGIITALRMPDRNGALADVVLGFNDLAPYAAGHPFFGALVGRVAGRITKGELVLPGETRRLVLNDPPNHLHGGLVGFDKRVWRAEPVKRPDGADSLRLTYHSPDGEEGYPGNLDIAITYTLSAQNELIIDSEATTDRVTPLSMTQHTYFNLAGEGSGSVADHEVQILAREYVPAADDRMTLSGRRTPVAGTANDFTTARRLGDALPGIYRSHGENYLMRATACTRPELVATVRDPASGRVLKVLTNDCCLQFYTGLSLDDTLTGKSGRTYGPHAGLCLECQGYPDGAHRPDLGDILVQPGTPQRRTTIYAFSTS